MSNGTPRTPHHKGRTLNTRILCLVFTTMVRWSSQGPARSAACVLLAPAIHVLPRACLPALARWHCAACRRHPYAAAHQQGVAPACPAAAAAAPPHPNILLQGWLCCSCCQVFGVLATLSLISLRSTQAANFELSQRLLLAGEQGGPSRLPPAAARSHHCRNAGTEQRRPPLHRPLRHPAPAALPRPVALHLPAEQNAATIMGTLQDAQDSLERVSGEAAAATKGLKQAKQDLHTVGARCAVLCCAVGARKASFRTNGCVPELPIIRRARRPPCFGCCARLGPGRRLLPRLPTPCASLARKPAAAGAPPEPLPAEPAVRLLPAAAAHPCCS